jgi:hypothetical protein
MLSLALRSKNEGWSTLEASPTNPIRLPDNLESERLEENIGAVAVALTSDDLGEIESAVSKITVVGDRHSGALRHLSDI